jgi:hypothetical protein
MKISISYSSTSLSVKRLNSKLESSLEEDEVTICADLARLQMNNTTDLTQWK